MKKDNLENKENLVSLKHSNEEVLEISSTGYGLESVSKENGEASKENGLPSCGGL
ncbi:hypothetical protein [Mesobacillus foraminis]|uniref:hypothetical protein n=1 Tax=Mesobacillus foraminis TaxID=279826 RepID=UPI0013CE559E|nr:hypothetical protein [Mesobacillus foraminis]MBT2759011.1 hypothetical protein [Mesobacillus foraminis]